MQVLIVATDIQTRGGIARYTWTLASALGGLIGGRNVHVLALVGKGGAGEIPEDFRILDVVTERLTLIAKIRFAGKALAQARHRYDLVVCTHLALAPIAGAIRLVYGSPYWVACHGTEAWRPLGPTKLLALRCADLVLPISRFTASMLHKVSRIPQSIMRVLYNAIPEGFTRMLASRQDAGTVRAERNGDSKWLLSVGSLSSGHSYKGFDVVIRALPEVLKAVPNLRYEIVGEGQDKERLKKLADEVGVGHKVNFTGEISDPELAAHYRTCDIFVLPSKTSQRNRRNGKEKDLAESTSRRPWPERLLSVVVAAARRKRFWTARQAFWLIPRRFARFQKHCWRCCKILSSRRKWERRDVAGRKRTLRSPQ